MRETPRGYKDLTADMGTRDQELVPRPLPVLELCRRSIAEYTSGLTQLQGNGLQLSRAATRELTS